MQKTLKTFFLTFTFSLFIISSVNAQAEALTQERKAELKNLLIQDCGSCHGMTLKGGLGPALTPDVLKNKARQMIEVTITFGRPGTPMPPWGKILTKQEIDWIVNTLYAGVKSE
ncbi:MAG: cytochrome c [Gammaproteobacteria bacterium]|nr:cytochrome c [Gammaproteobacteria bacterium]